MTYEVSLNIIYRCSERNVSNVVKLENFKNQNFHDRKRILDHLVRLAWLKIETVLNG